MMKNGIEQHLKLTVVLPAIAGISREHYHAAPFNRHLDDRRSVFYLARTPHQPAQNRFLSPRELHEDL